MDSAAWCAFAGAAVAVLAATPIVALRRRRGLPSAWWRLPFGAAVTLPVTVIELTLRAEFPLKQRLGHILLLAFAFSALPEELCKAGALLRRVSQFDAITRGALVGLGFSAIENAIYCMSLPGRPGALAIFAARAVMSVPGHAVYSAVFALALSGRSRVSGLLAGLIGAIGLHGAFDGLGLSVQLAPGAEPILRLAQASVVWGGIAWLCVRARRTNEPAATLEPEPLQPAPAN